MNYHLHLFGPVRLLQSQESVPKVRRKSIALLAYLATEARAVSREQLVDLFWPDQPASKGRRNLSWSLSNLAANLPECLTAAPQSVTFVGHADLTIDTLKTHALITSSSLETRPNSASIIKEALAQIDGPFMDGFLLRGAPEFEAWQAAQRASWENHQQQLLAQIVTILQQQGDGEIAQAYHYAQQWVQAFPWSEEAHRQLMRLLAIRGEKRQALQQFAHCQQILKEELDVEPSPDTVALYQQIFNDEPMEWLKEAGNRPPEIEQPAIAQSNFPLFLTPFIGRFSELAALEAHLLDSNHRLITLVGAGGSGKTRLATAAAQQLCDQFSDGAYFVPLADVTAPVDGLLLDDPLSNNPLSGHPLSEHPAADDLAAKQSQPELGDRVASAIGDALGLTQSGKGTWAQRLQEHLGARHALLILDNFEHLVAEAEFVIDLLSKAPKVTILVTSRQPLNLMAEMVMPINGLTIPQEDDAAPTTSESVKLFIDRAKRTLDGLSVDGETLAEIVQLCRYVVGNPLAIELLAPLFASGVVQEELHVALTKNFDLAVTARLDVPMRQRSIRTVFNHSWSLLTAEEQQILAGCALFRSPFTVEAVVAVALPQAEDNATSAASSLAELFNSVDTNGVAQDGESEAALHLHALFQKSLLVRIDGTTYTMHPLLSQFANERLRQRAASHRPVSARYARYFLGRLAQAEQKLQGPEESATLVSLATHREDIFAAWQWAVEHQKAALIGQSVQTFVVLCDLQGWWRDGRQALVHGAHAIRGIDSHTNKLAGPLRVIEARLHAHQAVLCFRQRAFAEADSLARRALELLKHVEKECIEREIVEREPVEREHDEVPFAYLSAAKQGLGSVSSSSGALPAVVGRAPTSAHPCGEDIDLRLPTEKELATERAFIEKTLGNIAFLQGDLDRALCCYNQSLARYQSVDEPANVAQCLSNVAIALSGYKDATLNEQIRGLLQESLALRRQLGDQRGISLALSNLASFHYQREAYALADGYFHESYQIRCAMQDMAGMATMLLMRSSCAYYQGDFERTYGLAAEGWTCHEAIGNQSGLSLAALNMGHGQCGMGNYAKGRTYLETALDLAVAVAEKSLIAKTLHFVVQALFRGQTPHPPDIQEKWPLLFQIQNYVFHNPSTSRGIRPKVEKQLIALGETLSAEEAQAAQEPANIEYLDEAVMLCQQLLLSR